MKKTFIRLLVIVICLAIIISLPTNPNKQLLLKLDSTVIENWGQFSASKYAIIIDYDKPIFKKRLWVLDIETKETVINSHVSHALKSGLIWASRFSNVEGSNISSKGIFKTLNSYESNHGKGIYKIGMRIKGLEKGINDKAFQRNIVFHCSYGFWSSGCFMTFPSINKNIIDITKDGSLLIVN